MPEHALEVRAGLVTTAETPVPLAGVTVDADVRSSCARVVVTQRYRNDEKTPIEAVYLFPLDESSAVCGFEAIIDGTLVIGEVKEREEAFRTYDDALEAGHGAYLLDEERPDVFQASIGNLPPGSEALVRITYVTELDVADGVLRFTIPTTISPRYAPAQDRAGVGRPDAETLNPPREWEVPYGLSLSIRLAMPAPIARLESPSHPISVSPGADGTTITLSQRDAALDRDFVLSVDVPGFDSPRAWIERDEAGEVAVAITFVPELPASQVASEVIFLVDRSGSMGGHSIEEVRNALQLCLRSLTPGCRFNIIGFGSRFEALFDRSVPYDDANLKAAAKHVASMDADLGGTEILPALEHVFATPGDRGRSRQVIVLTDGQVSNTDEVLALAAKHAGTARVFTFGIGAGASRHLVRGLARAGGGAAEFIFPRERIEPKVLRALGRVLSPVLGDVRLDWGGLNVTAAPSRVPPLFSGERMTIYGFVKEAKPTTIRLSANTPSGPVSFDVAFDPAIATPGRTVATLAARQRIRGLEESPEWLAARRSQQGRARTPAASREIVELGVKYSLVSRETSFVAVERRETPVQGELQLRRVPIALTSGWGGLTLGAPMAMLGPSACAPIDGARPRIALQAGFDADALGAPASLQPRAALGDPARTFRGLAGIGSWFRSERRLPTDSTRPARVAVEHERLLVLIGLQAADGSWALTPEFAGILGLPFQQLEAFVAGVDPADEARRAWATALALAWLDEHAAEFADEWRLLAAKATRWLDVVTVRPPSNTTWQQAATSLGD